MNKYLFLSLLGVIVRLATANAQTSDPLPWASIQNDPSPVNLRIVATENGNPSLIVTEYPATKPTTVIRLRSNVEITGKIDATGNIIFDLSAPIQQTYIDKTDRFEADIIIKTNDNKDGVKRTLKFKKINGQTPRDRNECRCANDVQTVMNSQPKCDKWTEKENFGLTKLAFSEEKVVYTFDYATKVYYRTKQDENGDIITEKIKNINKLKFLPNEDVSFRIINVNLFMNTARVQDSTFSFDNEPPYLIRQLLFPDSAASVGLLTRWNNIFTGTQNTAKASASGSDGSSSPLQCFYNCYYSLKASVLAAFNPCSNFPCCSDVSDNYVKLMTAYNTLVGDITVAEDAVKRKKDTLQAIEAALESCAKAKKDLEKAEAQVKKLTDEGKTDKEEFKTATAQVKTATEALQKCAPAPYMTQEKRNIILDELVELNRLVAAKSLLANLEPEIAKMTVFVNNMVRENQEIWQDISVLGDRQDIFIEVRTKDSIASALGIPKKIYTKRLEVPVIMRPIVTFSTGTFIGLSDEFQLRSYNWQEVPDINNTIGGQGKATRYKLANSGISPRPAGFCALANVCWRTGRSFGFGPSVGAGLTIERDPRMAYMAGASVFFGELRQLGITAGILSMKTNKLQPYYQSIVDNSILSTSAGSIEYYQKLVAGGFVSITYTPIKVIKH